MKAWPCFVVDLLVGAVLMFALLNRYQLSPGGGAHVVKLDRLTGQSWTAVAGDSVWRPMNTY